MRKIKLAAQMFIDDTAVHQGQPLSKEEQDAYLEKARGLSIILEGVVELHIVMCHGSRHSYIDAYDTWMLGVFDNGQEKSKEYMG